MRCKQRLEGPEAHRHASERKTAVHGHPGFSRLPCFRSLAVPCSVVFGALLCTRCELGIWLHLQRKEAHSPLVSIWSLPLSISSSVVEFGPVRSDQQILTVCRPSIPRNPQKTKRETAKYREICPFYFFFFHREGTVKFTFLVEVVSSRAGTCIR